MGLAYRNGVRVIWKYRQILRMFVSRDLQRQYRTFRLGYLWSILEPAGMTLVMYVVFQYILGARKFGEHPYLLFLAVAITPWWWFTKGIGASTKVFRRGTAPLRISVLPTQIWVLRILIVSTAEFVLSLPIVIVAIIVTRTLPGPLIVLYPVAVALQFLLMYGLSLFVSSVSARVPDFARIVRIIMRAMFYFTPVLYSVTHVPEKVQSFAGLNPLVGILGLYRIGFWPSETEAMIQYGLSLAVCVALFVLGLVTFRLNESRILKEA